MSKKIFVNFTNHPSNFWSETQRIEAEKYGDIIDISFPSVKPECCEKEIENLSEQYANKICQEHPAAVLCQGEFCLSYSVIKKLLGQNIRVVAACSERKVTYEGSRKIVKFNFVKFREYK